MAYARELEAQDASLAEAIAEVDGLHREAREIHERAAHAEHLLARVSAERAAAGAAVDEAAAELAQREAEAKEAEEELARVEGSQKEEAVLAARRAAVRTRDAAASAERKLVRAREALEGIEQHKTVLRSCLLDTGFIDLREQPIERITCKSASLRAPEG